MTPPQTRLTLNDILRDVNTQHTYRKRQNEIMFINIVFVGRVNRQPTTNEELLDKAKVMIVNRQKWGFM